MSYDADIGVLPIDLSMGSGVGMGFLTGIVQTAAGREYRDSLRSYELGRWVVRYDAALLAKSQELRAIFRAAAGMGRSFRARDPLDYTVDSSEGRFVATSVSTEWQMVKRYTTREGATYDRKITKPGPGATASSGTVNEDTGIVTNATMPASWQSPLFYVQVRFDSDLMNPRIITRNGSDGDLIEEFEVDVVEVDEA